MLKHSRLPLKKLCSRATTQLLMPRSVPCKPLTYTAAVTLRLRTPWKSLIRTLQVNEARQPVSRPQLLLGTKSMFSKTMVLKNIAIRCQRTMSLNCLRIRLVSTTFMVNDIIGKKQCFVSVQPFLETSMFMSRTPFARVPVKIRLCLTHEHMLTKLLVSVKTTFSLTDLDTRPVCRTAAYFFRR